MQGPKSESAPDEGADKALGDVPITVGAMDGIRSPSGSFATQSESKDLRLSGLQASDFIIEANTAQATLRDSYAPQGLGSLLPLSSLGKDSSGTSLKSEQIRELLIDDTSSRVELTDGERTGSLYGMLLPDTRRAVKKLIQSTHYLVASCTDRSIEKLRSDIAGRKLFVMFEKDLDCNPRYDHLAPKNTLPIFDPFIQHAREDISATLLPRLYHEIERSVAEILEDDLRRKKTITEEMSHVQSLYARAMRQLECLEEQFGKMVTMNAVERQRFLQEITTLKEQFNWKNRLAPNTDNIAYKPDYLEGEQPRRLSTADSAQPAPVKTPKHMKTARMTEDAIRNLSDAERRLLEKQNRLRELMDQCKLLDSEIADWERKLQDAFARRAKIDELRAQIADLDKALQDAQDELSLKMEEARQRRAQLEAELAELEEKNKQLEVQVTTAQKKSLSTEKKKKEEGAGLEKKIPPKPTQAGTKEKPGKDTGKKDKDASDAANNKLISDLRRQIEDLKAQLRVKQEELDDARAQVAARNAEVDAARRRAEELAAALRNEKGRHEDSFTEEEVNMSTSVPVNVDSPSLSLDSRLQKELADKDAELRDLQAQLEIMREHLAAARRMLDSRGCMQSMTDHGVQLDAIETLSRGCGPDVYIEAAYRKEIDAIYQEDATSLDWDRELLNRDSDPSMVINRELVQKARDLLRFSIDLNKLRSEALSKGVLQTTDEVKDKINELRITTLDFLKEPELAGLFDQLKDKASEHPTPSPRQLVLKYDFGCEVRRGRDASDISRSNTRINDDDDDKEPSSDEGHTSSLKKGSISISSPSSRRQKQFQITYDSHISLERSDDVFQRLYDMAQEIRERNELLRKSQQEATRAKEAARQAVKKQLSETICDAMGSAIQIVGANGLNDKQFGELRDVLQNTWDNVSGAVDSTERQETPKDTLNASLRRSTTSNEQSMDVDTTPTLKKKKSRNVIESKRRNMRRGASITQSHIAREAVTPKDIPILIQETKIFSDRATSESSQRPSTPDTMTSSQLTGPLLTSQELKEMVSSRPPKTADTAIQVTRESPVRKSVQGRHFLFDAEGNAIGFLTDKGAVVFYGKLSHYSRGPDTTDSQSQMIEPAPEDTASESLIFSRDASFETVIEETVGVVAPKPKQKQKSKEQTKAQKTQSVQSMISSDVVATQTDESAFPSRSSVINYKDMPLADTTIGMSAYHLDTANPTELESMEAPDDMQDSEEPTGAAYDRWRRSVASLGDASYQLQDTTHKACPPCTVNYPHDEPVISGDVIAEDGYLGVIQLGDESIEVVSFLSNNDSPAVSDLPPDISIDSPAAPEKTLQESGILQVQTPAEGRPYSCRAQNPEIGDVLLERESIRIERAIRRRLSRAYSHRIRPDSHPSLVLHATDSLKERCNKIALYARILGGCLDDSNVIALANNKRLLNRLQEISRRLSPAREHRLPTSALSTAVPSPAPTKPATPGTVLRYAPQEYNLEDIAGPEAQRLLNRQGQTAGKNRHTISGTILSTDGTEHTRLISSFADVMRRRSEVFVVKNLDRFQVSRDSESALEPGIFEETRSQRLFSLSRSMPSNSAGLKSTDIPLYYTYLKNHETDDPTNLMHPSTTLVAQCYVNNIDEHTMTLASKGQTSLPPFSTLHDSLGQPLIFNDRFVDNTDTVHMFNMHKDGWPAQPKLTEPVHQLALVRMRNPKSRARRTEGVPRLIGKPIVESSTTRDGTLSKQVPKALPNNQVHRSSSGQKLLVVSAAPDEDSRTSAQPGSRATGSSGNQPLSLQDLQ
ncbi:putative Spindle pole protein [Giardia muris]|uniref:Putative Spindle pole protein n=1 Tax=Giardia muris TaxID=5742 RepID=A0A4Z1STH1_GIAMU|nr:putative Spindle pole protein [Giardia muris]|eukprot:TNJ29050.1 putative Spindle pole protein [Giardia muris]